MEIDQPGEFFHVGNNKDVIVVQNGRLAEVMVLTVPQIYRYYVIHKKGCLIQYVQLQKAINGVLKSVLLVYKKLLDDMEKIELKLNSYDPCKANKMVDGHQMMIV